jgi:hypothetical protein
MALDDLQFELETRCRWYCTNESIVIGYYTHFYYISLYYRILKILTIACPPIPLSLALHISLVVSYFLTFNQILIKPHMYEQYGHQEDSL